MLHITKNPKWSISLLCVAVLSTGWSIGSIWQIALSAAVAFARVLATVLVWLVVFSVYIIPVALIVWFSAST